MQDVTAVARRLAATYGHSIDGPLVYPAGVAISGRLRLAALTDTLDAEVADVAALTSAVVADADAAFDRRFGLAGLTGAVWAEEMFDATGEEKYRGFLVDVVAAFDVDRGAAVTTPLDDDIRVEDFFFAAALLGRAYKVTTDERYLDALTRYLLAVDTQQRDALFWHCHASPFYWGRGNAFAALGFAEALTYVPSDHEAFAELTERHLRHLNALRQHQHTSGMWHQIIDDPTTYLEHSATTILTCVIARGVRLGWLDQAWRDVIEHAWHGIAQRIGDGCELEHVCVGTGPLPSLGDYVERGFTDGVDDRGGAMALWCAVEILRLADR